MAENRTKKSRSACSKARWSTQPPNTLGRSTSRNASWSQLGELGTPHDTGGVKHPAHGWPAGYGQSLEYSLDGMLVGHVGLSDVDAGAPTLQLEHRGDPAAIRAARRGLVPLLARRKHGAPQQDDVAGATIDHPLGDLLPQVSQSTCHEVRRVAAKLFGRRRLGGPGTAHETRRVPSTSTKRQLPLPTPLQDDCGQFPGRIGRRGSRIQVDQASEPIGQLHLSRSSQTPDWCLKRVDLR